MRPMSILIVSFVFFLLGCTPSPVDFSALTGDALGSVDIVRPQPVQPQPIEDITSPRPPIVRIIESPKDHYLGSSTAVQYEVIIGSNHLHEVKCFIGPLNVQCSPEQDLIQLSMPEAGAYHFRVVATDTQGLSAQDHAQWSVFDRFIQKSKTVQVESTKNKLDILFVVDNSGSMQDRQAHLARRIGGFFERIQNLDWRVGIITTDPYLYDPISGRYNPLADGALIQYPNNQYFLQRSDGLDFAREQFQKTIYRPEVGNGHERGIYNTYRAIERSQNPVNSVNQRLNRFFRSDAALVAVILSDEDETLVDGIGRPLPHQHKSDGVELMKLVRNTWGQNKLFQFNSIIVRPGDYDCLGPNEKFGYLLDHLSQRSGGLTTDICAADYSHGLNAIGDGAVKLQTRFRLSCTPQGANELGQPMVEVHSTQGQIDDFVIEKDEIQFTESLPDGEYRINYLCPNDQLPN
jgi:hypothetical protein